MCCVLWLGIWTRTAKSLRGGLSPLPAQRKEQSKAQPTYVGLSCVLMVGGARLPLQSYWSLSCVDHHHHHHHHHHHQQQRIVSKATPTLTTASRSLLQGERLRFRLEKCCFGGAYPMAVHTPKPEKIKANRVSHCFVMDVRSADSRYKTL